MNFVGPLWRLRLPDLLPRFSLTGCLPERWPLPFPKAPVRCRCGHPEYMHRPLLRSDGTREDGLRGEERDEKRSIDPCSWIGCGCGYYQPTDAH